MSANCPSRPTSIISTYKNPLATVRGTNAKLIQKIPVFLSVRKWEKNQFLLNLHRRLQIFSVSKRQRTSTHVYTVVLRGTVFSQYARSPHPLWGPVCAAQPAKICTNQPPESDPAHRKKSHFSPNRKIAGWDCSVLAGNNSFCLWDLSHPQIRCCRGSFSSNNDDSG